MGHFDRQFDCRVRVLRTDGGGEYVNIDLFCERTGIARQRTEADNPASNGKAERMHHTVLTMARCMIFNCQLPMQFWGDAVKYAAYVLNRSPCKANPKRCSPMEMLEDKPPNLTQIVNFMYGLSQAWIEFAKETLSTWFDTWRFRRSERFPRLPHG
jgi:hypothetical protein